jgi:hypothetical protein
MRNLAVMLLLVGCAGARFRTNTVRQIAAPNPQAAFETALATVRGEGYTVTELDAPRGFFRVKSKIDGDMQGHIGIFGHFRMSERTSYLSFQVQPDATLAIFTSGYHVRGDKVHVKVDEELTRLAG